MFAYFWGDSLGNMILSLHVLLMSPLSKFMWSFSVSQCVGDKDWILSFAFLFVFFFLFLFFVFYLLLFAFLSHRRYFSSRHPIRNSEPD